MCTPGQAPCIAGDFVSDLSTYSDQRLISLFKPLTIVFVTVVGTSINNEVRFRREARVGGSGEGARTKGLGEGAGEQAVAKGMGRRRWGKGYGAKGLWQRGPGEGTQAEQSSPLTFFSSIGIINRAV